MHSRNCVTGQLKELDLESVHANRLQKELLSNDADAKADLVNMLLKATGLEEKASLVQEPRE